MRRVRRRSSTLFRPEAGSLEPSNMEYVDQILKAQVEGEDAPLHNACYIVMDKNGTLYSRAYGSRDVARSQPIDLDCLHWIASLTKLSTAIAAMIAVEKGLVTLDQNVREIVPELAELDILEGFEDDDTPKLRKCISPISLRQLLSHSSGFCYDQHHEGLQRWARYVGKTENTFTGSHVSHYQDIVPRLPYFWVTTNASDMIQSGYLYPLVFEPGHGWAYGSGMDWAGRTIEIVAGQDLETFMKTNIWTPLCMNSTTFQPWSRPDLEAKLVELAWRGQDGKLIEGKNPYGPAVHCCGGVGLFSTPRDQAKLLAALLSDGRGVMSKASLDELMSPQTEDPSHFLSVVCGTKRAHLGQTWPGDSKGDFGLSSSINATDFPGRRAANSANWQGMPGIHAWLDRETGLAGLFTTQLLPPGDKAVTEVFCALEEEVYRVYGSRV